MNRPDTSAETPLFRYRFDQIEFDEVRFELSVAGLPVDLEQKPLQVLALLLRHVGEVVTREELFERVWQGRPTVDNVLPNAVAKLRKALGADTAERIVTLPRMGYRFNGPVERIAAGRRVFSRLQLDPARDVPLRPSFTLERQLSPARSSEVWLARHVKTGEPRVFKFASDGERLALLKREATLSRLLREALGDRDDFSRVLDWNFDSPPFFLECEYGGDNLQDWSGNDRGSLGRMDRPARIDLFLRIADAIAAAHGVGVLHKDIKPANILIAPRGAGWRICIADFGSARLLNPDRLSELGITRLGLTVTPGLDDDTSSGTPLYLAPELLMGATPTIRSDVYSLGLLLYQLLVGDLQRPLAPGWERDIDDPLLRTDIADATDGDTTRRLASVVILTERLRSLALRRDAALRDVERDRQLAASEEMLTRSRAQRPWIIAASVLLAGGLAATLWQNQQIRTARAEAERQAKLATEMNRFLNDDLLGTGRSRSSTIAYDRNPTLRELIDAARQRLEGRFSEAPLVEAGLRSTLGLAYRTLGDFNVAEAQLRRVTELRRATLLPEDPSRLAAEYELATVLVRLSRFEEASRLLDAADSQAGQRLEQQSPLALQAHLARGTFHYQQLQAREALTAYRIADRLQRALRPDDAVLATHIRLTIGGCELRLGEPGRAEAIARDVLDSGEFTDRNVGLSTLAMARRLLGDSLRNQGRPADAIPHLERAVAEQESSRGPDDQSTISTLSSLAYAYSLAGDADARVTRQREVYARAARRWGDENQYTLVERLNLGDAEHDAGRGDVAAAHVAAALSGLEKVSGADSAVVHAARYSYASVLATLGKADAARRVVSRIDPDKLAAASSDAAGHEKLVDLSARIDALP